MTRLLRGKRISYPKVVGKVREGFGLKVMNRIVSNTARFGTLQHNNKVAFISLPVWFCVRFLYWRYCDWLPLWEVDSRIVRSIVLYSSICTITSAPRRHVRLTSIESIVAFFVLLARFIKCSLSQCHGAKAFLFVYVSETYRSANILRNQYPFIYSRWQAGNSTKRQTRSNRE